MISSVVTMMTKTSTILPLSSENNLLDTTRKLVDIRGLLVDSLPDILTKDTMNDTMAAAARGLQTLVTGLARQWPKTAIETFGEKTMDRVINITSISMARL